MLAGFLSRMPAVLVYRLFLCGGILRSWWKLHTRRPCSTHPQPMNANSWTCKMMNPSSVQACLLPLWEQS